MTQVVGDANGAQLPVFVPRAVIRFACSSTVDAKDCSATPPNMQGQRVVTVDSAEKLRFGTGATKADAEAAVTNDGSGANPSKPAGLILVALPAGHTWLALVPDSAAASSPVDTTIELP